MTVMQEDRFWDLVRRSGRVLPAPNATDRSVQCAELHRLLSKLDADSVRAFDARFYIEYAKAYHWDLRLAVYVLQDGCSDDWYDVFVKSLISTGRRLFYAAICSPDRTLAKHWRLFPAN